MSGTQNGQLSTDPFHVYYNISIQNDDTTGLNPPPILKFDEIRNNTILQNPSDYFLSVVRFSVDTPTLPQFIPERDQSIPGNVNSTIYSVTYQLGNVIRQGFVQYVPQSPFVATPAAAPATQNISTSTYYYIYQPENWMIMVNKCLADTWDAFCTDMNAVVPTFKNTCGGDCPYFTFDKDSKKATLWTRQNVFQMQADGVPTAITYTADVVTAGGGPVQIYFNAPLYDLFSSITSLVNGFPSINVSSSSQGRNYRLCIYDDFTGNPLTAPTTYLPPTYTQQQATSVAPTSCAHLATRQEYATLQLWNPVSSIVFTTAGFPVNAEQVSNPVVFGYAARNLLNSGNNANIANVLTDFEVPLIYGDEYKPNISYVPSGEYRLIDLQSNSPLNNLQVSVSWKDATGTIHPFLLGSGATANLKIMFRKKTFNTGY